MDVIDCIKKRKSVRKYLDKDLSWDIVGRILDLGRYAPAAGNLQNTRFIVVTNDKIKKKIAEACLQQYWMEQAPVLIVVCSDNKDLRSNYGFRGEKLYSIQNTSVVIENILLAATSLGISSCFVSAFNEDAVRRVLKIPKGIRPHAVVSLGYSDEKRPEIKKASLESLSHFEEWGKRRRNTEFWPLVKQIKRIKKKKIKKEGFLDKLRKSLR